MYVQSELGHRLTRKRRHTPTRANFQADFFDYVDSAKRRAARLWKDLDEIFPTPLFFVVYAPPPPVFGENRH